jgi:hypothetical protein
MLLNYCLLHLTFLPEEEGRWLLQPWSRWREGERDT